MAKSRKPSSEVEKEFDAAFRNQDLPRVQQLCTEYKINEPPEEGDWPINVVLREAVLADTPQPLQLLLAAGLDPNHPWGMLNLAAEKGRVDAVAMLLQAGADPNAKDTFGGILLCGPASGRTPQHFACLELLLQAGADPNSSYDELGPLHLAAGHGSPASIRALVKAGADLYAINGLYGNALCFSASKNRLENLWTLLDLGADPLRIAFDESTALEFAKGERLKTAYMLMKHASEGQPLPPLEPATPAEALKVLKASLKSGGLAKAAKLRKGAMVEQITALESVIGQPLPASLKEWYMKCDGQEHDKCNMFITADGDEEPGFVLNSLAEVEAQWKKWGELLEAGTFQDSEVATDSEIQDAWWDIGWLPVADGGDGDCFFVDLHPTTEGTVGQVVYLSHEEGPQRVVATSMADWIIKIAETIEVIE